jgi:flagellar basal body-associated protein FliL
MKKTNKIMLVVILIVLILGIFFIQKIFSSGPIELIKGEKSNPQQKESNNLETYEEDFKAIDEALNNID